MQKNKKLDKDLLTRIGLLVMVLGLAVMGLFPLLEASPEKPVPDTLQPRRMPDYIGANLGIINYVDDELTTVFIDKQWAGNSAALSTGTGICCVSLPTQWKPGMQMLISWASASMYTSIEEPDLAERMVDVLPYEPFIDGHVWVIFLPGGVIRVQPSPASPGATNFLNGLPYPGMASKEQLAQFIRDTDPSKGP